MPNETIREPLGIYQKFWGELQSSELYESLKVVHNDPDFESVQYVIKDYLNVELFEVGVKTIMEGLAMNARGRRTNPDVIVAIVTTNPDIIGSCREALSFGINAYPRKVFPTVETARDWIRSFGEKPTS